ncbi:OsmC family protein [Streptomyces sp. NPDC000345]|uniref:OsmC family protein n=1 Tax=Streptomyces sp. NPDC000345 TaxID=3364537 RepID=UPI00368720D9
MPGRPRQTDGNGTACGGPPAPGQAYRSALASAQGIELKTYRLELEGDIDLRGFLGVEPTIRPGLQQVRVRLHVDAPDTPREQLDELISLVESRSPIRDTLVSPVDVITTLA